MSDLKLVNSPVSPYFGDLELDGNDLVLTVGTVENVGQNILQRLRTYLGEWFLDNAIGLPYYQQILVKNPDQGNIDAIFLNAILGTRGVQQVNRYEFRVDFNTRQLFVTFSAQTVQGTVDYQGALQAA